MLRPITALAVALAVALPVLATTVLDVPLDRMARETPLIVEGTVVARKTEWTEGRGRLVTRTTLKVSKILKGETAKDVVIWQFGGSLDGVTMGVPGDATFGDGEQVLVFLEPHPKETGAFVLVAMSAAKFTLEKAADGVMARRELGGLAFAAPDEEGVIRPAPPAARAVLPVDELRRTILEATR